MNAEMIAALVQAALQKECDFEDKVRLTGSQTEALSYYLELMAARRREQTGWRWPFSGTRSAVRSETGPFPRTARHPHPTGRTGRPHTLRRGTRRQGDRSWARPAVLVFAVMCLVKLALVGFGVAALAAYVEFGPEHPLAAVAAQNMRCTEVHRIVAANGEQYLMDVGPGRFSENRGDCGSFRTAPFEPDVDTLPFATAIGPIEGRWKTGQTLFGQDLWGVIRHGVALVVPGMVPAGTGPLQSAFETLAGNPHAVTGDGFLGRYLRKANYVLAGSQFIHRHLTTDEARARFLAERQPVLTNTGGDLAGAAATYHLFGGPPVSLAEVCLFAAATGYPIKVKPHGEFIPHAALQDIQARWERNIVRATNCVGALATDDQERAEAESELAAMSIPVVDVRRTLPDGAREVVRAALRAIPDPLTPQTFDLALLMDAQDDVSRAMPHLLERIQSRLPVDTCLTGECRNHLDHSLVVAEQVGSDLLVRLASTNRSDSVYGPFEAVEAGYRPLPPRTSQGSLNKILVALPIAAAGETRLCNRAHGGVTNPGGDRGVADCQPGDGAGWVPVEYAIQRSMNLPFIEAVNRMQGDVDSLQEALGFLGGPITDPAMGAVFGAGRNAPPSAYLTLMGALESGQTNGLSPFVDVSMRGVDLDALGYSTTHRETVSRWLEFPLRPRGTLYQAARAIDVPGCTVTGGKSGTHSIDGVRLAKVAIIRAACGPRTYLAYAAINSPDNITNLGPVTQTNLARMIRLGIGAIQRRTR